MRRPLLLAAVLLLTVAGAPALAVIKYVAIGDSITAGSSWPVTCNICPVVFDCAREPACGAAQSKRDACGHVIRLDEWLGVGYYVRNEGVGGEVTASAASNFAEIMDAQCAGSPGECVAVLLMHGTNDMEGSVSPESARANLGFIVDQAKSRNIDVVLMTIIRRGEDPGNTKWISYRDEVLDLAADEDLVLVNPFQTLCPDQSCYDVNYWLADTPPCDDPDAVPHPGHLDSDGYEELANLVKLAFPGSLPAAPTPTSPSGDLTDTSPEFVWPEVATARWYQLDVDGAFSWWEAAAHCAAGTCMVDPGVVLNEGAHSWRVQARNLLGPGAWSAATPFTVWGVPGTPTPAAPQGQYFDSAPMTAPFPWEPYEWGEASDTTDYDLVVSNGGGPVVTESFTSSICSASTCSAAPAEGLAAGSYSWRVTARNPAVSGPTSMALAFEVFDAPPGEPTPIAPTGERFAPLATLYELLPVPGATEYDLEVRDAGGNLDDSAAKLAASTYCTATRCSYQGGSLSDPDDYTLKVKGRNPLGDGPLSSSGVTFTVLPCDDPSQKDLGDFFTSGAVGTPMPRKHCGPLTAAAAGPFLIESGANLTVHTGGGFSAFDGLTVEGTLSVQSP